jgi:gamma-glutamylcyclotransferase (GGCT)/AIG2-like uncharacterized protein YtfP
MREYLFLYGTLMPGKCDNVITPIVKRLHRVGTAYVPGRLYDFGEYPGAVVDPSSDTSVRGELVELPQNRAVLDELDRYEEFDPLNPSGSLFVRKKTEVRLADGRKRESWIYVYNRHPGDAPLVQGGDYSKSKVA